MEKMGLEEGQELEHFMLNKSIEQAQKRVEQQNFQRRKRTLEYDDVMNKQRGVIYGFRDEVINATDVRDRLMDIMEEVVIEKVRELTPESGEPADWDARPLSDWVSLNFPVRIPEQEILKAAKSSQELPVPGSAFEGLSAGQFSVCQFICKTVREAYELKISFEEPEALKVVERYIILKAVDSLWQEHLYGMDSLRDSIGLRAYGQRDPLIEYKAEAFKVFGELMTNIKTEICHNIFLSASSMMAFDKFRRNLPPTAVHQAPDAFGSTPPPGAQVDGKKASDMVKEATEAMAKAKPVRTGPKVGRNDPCPCRSGKKYKHCCGKNG
jgi:preprotein translocase subunit SecA